MKGRFTLLPFACALALSFASPRAAEASEEIKFGANDVPTVFFINKSDDKNRVDYGIRLDAACNPAGEDAMFQYWREFENSPPVRTHGLNMMERVAYGISDQRVVRRSGVRDEWLIRLKQLPRPITITTAKDPASGKCSATAHTTILGQESTLSSVYVKLGGVMSVDYIDIHGKNAATGQPVVERVRK
jgi:hypothetical protein